MGWARHPSCRAESVLELVVSQLRIPTGVEWTDLPMLGLSPGPFYTGHQMALMEGDTPRPDRQVDGQIGRQRTAMPRRQGGAQVRYGGM